jgi:hypothetical protein
MKHGDTIAAVTAGAAVATSAYSLADWASIASMVAAVFSIGLSVVNIFFRTKKETKE